MNYQGKNKLLLSIGTAVLIVMAIIVLVITTPDARPALFTLSGVIILMALAGVAFAFAKYKNIEARVSKLPDDYQSAYLNAHELIGTYEMSNSDRQNIMAMILEIFEHAHLDNRAVEDVIGGDLASFIESFANETGNAHTPGYLLCYSSSLFLIFLLFFKAYKVIRTGAVTLAAINSEALDVGIVVTYFIISYVFFPWLILSIRKSAREQWDGVQRLKILFPMLIPLGLMMSLIMIDSPECRAVIDRPFPIFSSPLSIIIGIVLLVGTILLTRRFRRK